MAYYNLTKHKVDWAGTKMRLFDPYGAPGIKVSVFVASMPYSGMIFALACPDERQHSWLDAHHHAFALSLIHI